MGMKITIESIMVRWVKYFLALCFLWPVVASAQSQEAYCATVKIEIAQELTLERQAFDAVMRINNGLDTLAIEDVNITVNFQDEDGLPVLATSDPNDPNPDVKFFVRIDSMIGVDNVSYTLGD